MEYSEKDLENILAGTNQEIAEEIALKNEELFRKKKIDALKEQRQEIINNLINDNQKKAENDYAK